MSTLTTQLRKTSIQVLELLHPKRAQRWKETGRPMAEGVITDSAALLNHGRVYEKAREDAAANPNLTAEGRRAASLSAARGLLAALTKVEAERVAVLRKRAAGIEEDWRRETSPMPTDAGSRVALELRLHEIRNQLRSLGLLERGIVYADSDDPLVRLAIETAPPVVTSDPKRGPRIEPFVNPELVKAAQFERAKATNPAAADLHAGLVEAADDLAFDVRELRSVALADFPELRGEVPSA